MKNNFLRELNSVFTKKVLAVFLALTSIFSAAFPVMLFLTVNYFRLKSGLAYIFLGIAIFALIFSLVLSIIFGKQKNKNSYYFVNVAAVILGLNILTFYLSIIGGVIFLVNTAALILSFINIFNLSNAVLNIKAQNIHEEEIFLNKENYSIIKNYNLTLNSKEALNKINKTNYKKLRSLNLKVFLLLMLSLSFFAASIFYFAYSLKYFFFITSLINLAFNVALCILASSFYFNLAQKSVLKEADNGKESI